eukprot:scaffold172_cov355-Prasinococcus_capsulatus_cf.AAC.7
MMIPPQFAAPSTRPPEAPRYLVIGVEQQTQTGAGYMCLGKHGRTGLHSRAPACFLAAGDADDHASDGSLAASCLSRSPGWPHRSTGSRCRPGVGCR